MQRHRFYATPDSIDGATINLSREETHHLASVLRLKAGDQVFVFDGCGREYRCSIASLKNRCALLEIIEPLTNNVESPINLTLGQALAKGEKFDLIVQKATELGTRRIVPLVTENAAVTLKDKQAEKRLERWRRISLEALKQSGRRTIVEIAAPVALSEFVSEVELRPDASRALLVFSERGGVSIDEALKATARGVEVIALVGPEGGWSQAELELLSERGAKAVTLGPRVLRTETAAIVAVSLIQHALGDIS
jgi:16S rRNA (uracil1498-N3)-methyltransferase